MPPISMLYVTAWEPSLTPGYCRTGRRLLHHTRRYTLPVCSKNCKQLPGCWEFRIHATMLVLFMVAPIHEIKTVISLMRQFASLGPTAPFVGASGLAGSAVLALRDCRRPVLPTETPLSAPSSGFLGPPDATGEMEAQLPENEMDIPGSFLEEATLRQRIDRSQRSGTIKNFQPKPKPGSSQKRHPIRTGQTFTIRTQDPQDLPSIAIAARSVVEPPPSWVYQWLCKCDRRGLRSRLEVRRRRGIGLKMSIKEGSGRCSA
ncbi:uncharacterized protein B0T15DRAFT_278055 [Chaetomium strumarium]|uniref:Uncharacterized protein n=1 Tax=Chaetomium strumarium TaxID=1170767 RepID=A0AAJ0LZK4_9PEZI|nr:hypothetical protein B0T15DRAFT_278055 [Chaetomium strumarium]